AALQDERVALELVVDALGQPIRAPCAVDAELRLDPVAERLRRRLRIDLLGPAERGRQGDDRRQQQERASHSPTLSGAALTVNSSNVQATIAPVPVNGTRRTSAQSDTSPRSRAATAPVDSKSHHTSTLGPAPEIVAPSAPSSRERSISSHDFGYRCARRG